MNWFQAGLYLALLGMLMGQRADIRRLQRRSDGGTDFFGIICIWGGVACMVFSVITGN